MERLEMWSENLDFSLIYLVMLFIQRKMFLFSLFQLGLMVEYFFPTTDQDQNPAGPNTQEKEIRIQVYSRKNKAEPETSENNLLTRFWTGPSDLLSMEMFWINGSLGFLKVCGSSIGSSRSVSSGRTGPGFCLGPRLRNKNCSGSGSEHAVLDVGAEKVSKVQVFGDELLLHALQRPLVVHHLQRLPLALKAADRPRRHSCTRTDPPEPTPPEPPEPTPPEPNSPTFTLKALLGSGGIAMAAPVIWSCMIRDWSAAVEETDQSESLVLSPRKQEQNQF